MLGMAFTGLDPFAFVPWPTPTRCCYEKFCRFEELIDEFLSC